MAEILAPMSGNIWKILVKEGDKVSEDDEIIIMEAMKMEIPITAPQDGVVKSLKVKEGDPVEADNALAEVE
ncbi:MAG: acetyl-CoA carboxylase biotin carboxyl carrier protein subunit [Deltaproteobacteria bacterium]|jgi:acetyl-CoA carboxylase biotin carboxyl carrier protein|nr:acetyl-CoA carboxylase biotin carboxyl carrier protein subunit [Deltaproteobacteria bacterium]